MNFLEKKSIHLYSLLVNRYWFENVIFPCQFTIIHSHINLNDEVICNLMSKFLLVSPVFSRLRIFLSVLLVFDNPEPNILIKIVLLKNCVISGRLFDLNYGKGHTLANGASSIFFSKIYFSASNFHRQLRIFTYWIFVVFYQCNVPLTYSNSLRLKR